MLNPARELLRHYKTLGLPEPMATPSQLARIRELALPLSEAAAATLTYAQVCTGRSLSCSWLFMAYTTYRVPNFLLA